MSFYTFMFPFFVMVSQVVVLRQKRDIRESAMVMDGVNSKPLLIVIASGAVQACHIIVCYLHRLHNDDKMYLLCDKCTA